MGKTSIEWTDHSINPLRARLGESVGHHCAKVSPGCKHCYSSRLQPRFRMPQFQEQRRLDVETFLDASKLEQVMRRRKPTKWFWCDMTDMFGDWVPNEWIAACFGVMAATPWHTHQVLTKRPERMKAWFGIEGIAERVDLYRCVALAGRIEEVFAPERVAPIDDWPGYWITSKGRVLSDQKGDRRALTPMGGEQGHSRVMLYRGEETWRPLIHRLVLAAFDGGDHALAGNDVMQGCHIDGDATNNALWNLRWGSQSSNWEDSKRHGTRRRYAKLTEAQVAELRARAANGETGASLGRAFGISDTQARNIASGKQWAPPYTPTWPLPGVWLGVSCEDQQRADERIPLLLKTPAAVRFVSAEPLLGPIDFCNLQWPERHKVDVLRGGMWTASPFSMKQPGNSFTNHSDLATLDWVIVGGESGPGARPCNIEWIRSIVAQCKSAGVACFVKQIGSRPTLGGEPARYSELPSFGGPDGPVTYRRITDRKGGNPNEWPEDLRVRQFPEPS